MTPSQINAVARAIDGDMHRLLVDAADTLVSQWARTPEIDSIFDPPNYAAAIDRIAADWIDLAAALEELRGHRPDAIKLDRAWFDERVRQRANEECARMENRGERMTDRQTQAAATHHEEAFSS